MTAVKPWYDNERFWEATYDFLFPPELWEKAAASVDDLVALLDFAPPAAVLDLCSGPGRFAIPLAQKGFAVTAVDRTQFYLDKLRERSCEQKVVLEIVTADMRDFVREGAFDAVLNVYTSFGFFDSPADDRKAVQNMYASLRPGGKLLIECVGRDFVVGNWQPRDWQEANGAYILHKRELIDDATRSHNRWIILREGKVEEFEFTHRLYGVLEYRSMLAQAGFSDVRAYGNLQGEAYTYKSFRLVIVAEK